MNQLFDFENELGTIRTTLINQEPYFIAKDIAEALGYKNTRDAISKHVDEEDKATVAIHDGSQNRNNTLINESGLYSLIFSSQLSQAKEFKRWVTKEVLPAIRQRGCFITEEVPTEAVVLEERYGKYRIKRTFSHIQYKDLDDTYQEAIAYIKDHYAASERIPLLNSLHKGLEDLHDKLLADPVSNMGKCYDIRCLQKKVIEVRNKTQNRSNGGIKSHQTRKILSLEEQLNSLYPSDDYFITINVHGFSNNYMYRYINGLTVKTTAYTRWINNFPAYALPELNHIDFNKSLRVYIYYTAKAEMDIRNMDKSFIDRLQAHYNFDDNIISEVISKRYATCNEYDEGQIAFYIENVEVQ